MGTEKDLEEVQSIIKKKFSEIAHLFVPGTGFTFIARHPDHQGSHMIATTENCLSDPLMVLINRED